MKRWFQDLKYSVRALLKSPQHTIIATLTLGLAIGVNTAIFSLMNQILFIYLPMEDPDEVYWVRHVNQETQSDITPLSLPNFQDFRDQSRTFESLAALDQEGMILTGVDQPARITVARVTADLMDVWRDQPTLGRGFVVGEDQPGGPKVAMITRSSSPSLQYETPRWINPIFAGRPSRQLPGSYFQMVSPVPASIAAT